MLIFFLLGMEQPSEVVEDLPASPEYVIEDDFSEEDEEDDDPMYRMRAPEYPNVSTADHKKPNKKDETLMNLSQPIVVEQKKHHGKETKKVDTLMDMDIRGQPIVVDQKKKNPIEAPHHIAAPISLKITINGESAGVKKKSTRGKWKDKNQKQN